MLLAAQFPTQWFLVLWLVCVAGAAFGWLVIYPRVQRGGPLDRFAARAPAGPVRWEGLSGIRYPLPRVGTMTATWPLARVSCDDESVCVRSSLRFFGFVVPTWRFRWDDLLVAEAVGMSRVRLRFRAIDAPVIVGGLTARDGFLDQLATHGVRIDRQSRPSSWWSTR